MGKSIVVGLWDCVHCGRKGISGLEKHCPGCGSPQDPNVTFYLGEEKQVLDETAASQYGKGADWVCSYCGSYNRYYQTECANCGASRAEREGDYFSVQEKKTAGPERGSAARRLSTGRRLSIALAAFLLLVLVIASLPFDRTASVTGKSWQREIRIERLNTYDESGWSVPDGGRVHDTRREVHHYESVLDHYEREQVQHSRTVVDGYETETTYVDNGDGTFTQETVQVPVYVTEYYYVWEDVPVYRDEPVYATRYYYEIDRWEYARSVITEGDEEDPYWGELVLGEKEREGTPAEHYTLEFLSERGKTYSADVEENVWRSMGNRAPVTITIRLGSVIRVNGAPAARSR